MHPATRECMASSMITYASWRDKYVEKDEHGLYVNYNAQGLSHPKDAITVSEASGYVHESFHCGVCSCCEAACHDMCFT